MKKLISVLLLSLILVASSISSFAATGASTVKSKDTRLYSSMYKIDNTKATIEIPLYPVGVEIFKPNIKPVKGATFTLVSKDGKSSFKGCDIPSQGVKVKVLAADKKTSKIYNIYRPKVNKWGGEGLAFPGKFADPEVVDLGNGTYRMYYCVNPDTPGNKHEIYSAISTDGKKWTKENGARRIWSVFPDVVKMPDGKWRMYFESGSLGIGSAISEDGLEWKDEPGIRIGHENTESEEFEQATAPSTTLLTDGTYLMVYGSSIQKKYNEYAPGSNTEVLKWATSTDGITFEKKGIAVDSRNDRFLGFMSSPEFYKWKDGSLRLFFFSHEGVFSSIYKDGKFSAPVIEFSTYSDKYLEKGYPDIKLRREPASDPTFAKIGATVFMYFGQKDIHYVTAK